MTDVQVWSATGIAMVMIGSWCVAIEVVNKFKGDSHTTKDATWKDGRVAKTERFTRWEARRNCWMWAGLALITLGSLAQLVSVFLPAE